MPVLRTSIVRSLLALGFVMFLEHSACAEFTINITAATLKTAGGQAMPASGLVVLVASTNGAQFGGPTATAFVSGGNIEVARWNLSNSTIFGAGWLVDSTGPTNLFGALASGQALALYWFPTLAIGDVAPGGGTSYGTYRDPVANGAASSGRDGSDPWYVPTDGSTISLALLTTDAGGSVSNAVGLASYTTAAAVAGTNSVTSVQVGVPGGGTNTIYFAGVAGYQYIVQYATNVTGPWVSFSTNTAATNGVWTVIDDHATNSIRFYRSFY